MKRHGDKSVNQPTVKKPDVNMSTDFRSKIGAKLQTLLNGFTPDRRLFPRNRRQLYADLFDEGPHSEIIIDPTIVIKSEPETEECRDDTTSFNSPNFLLSAKSRITALLNKQDGVPFKDNEKENSFSRNEYSSTSSSKTPNHSHSQAKSQSFLNTSLNKKRKLSCSRDDSTEPAINQVRLKNLVVVVEDIMNSKNRTKFSHLLPTQLVENKNSLENPESSSENLLTVSELNMEMDISTKDNAINEIPESFVSSDDVECIIDDRSTINQSSTDPHIFTDECCSGNSPQLYASGSKSPETAEASGSVFVKDSNLIPNVMTVEDFLLEKTSNQFSCSITDDSELVDDPSTDQAVFETANDSVMTRSNPEPEVVLLCVRRPTHEVITLEDDNDNLDDVIEEVHECVQCGKAFRAKSLLNFHIRMHGNDSSSSPSSSSQSYAE